MADQQNPPKNQVEPARANRQIVLPFAKSVEISLKSIKVRFFRSLITTMSLVLAVSFLSFVRVSNDVANGLLATQERQLRQAVIRSGYDLGPEDTNVGANPKQRWIIILSLLVCVVGIVNAQLMAVTERFREIGTMKCLGALDRFILRLFILESGMQGLAGAGAGALAGAGFALMGALLRYGFVSMSTVSWGAVIASVGIAIAVGCLLSLIGVLYPAIVAARMQPVEAMRVEQ
ncbi:MAG: FtsX-like permease family protein [Desulfobacterales bacterium]|nr:FtsX-like permease family protein [Desulfobacterales bacterium]